MMKAKQHSQYRDAKEILNSMASKLLDAENENNANIPSKTNQQIKTDLHTLEGCNPLASTYTSDNPYQAFHS